MSAGTEYPKLTLRQQAFVSAYIGIAKGNATEAARIASYAHPMQQGSLLLRKVEIARAVEAERKLIRGEGITNRQNRVNAYNDRWERMKLVIDERAADESMARVPGGKSGLLVRQWKKIGFGEDTEMVEEFAVDVGLLKELRELEKQGAVEAGEWNEKSADSPTVNVTITNELKAAVIGHDEFSAEFARLSGLGSARQDRAAESLDSAEANATAGLLSQPAGA